MKQKYVRFIALVVAVFFPVMVVAQEADPNFNPSKIVEDSVFGDTQTFGGPEGVQKFLDTKESVLANTAPDFITKLKEPEVTLLKQGLDDPHPNLGRLRSAAELIWDAAQASGLNPQIIIVTLNKEQSLITGHHDSSHEKLQKALDHSMGFDCPDASGCGDLFPGFYYQLFGNFDASGNRYLGAAKSLAKSFSYPGGRGPLWNGHAAQVGETITLDNTTGAYNVPSQQQVTIGNRATAALYRYTPHVFNGNYNFWRFFQAWFRYPNGTLLTLGSGNTVYIIQNGLKQVVPQFVATARNLNLSAALTVSQTELDSYQTDKVYGPSENTIVKVSGEDQAYVFINNIKRPASSFAISQRGLNTSNALTISPSESALFEQGPILTPTDGTVLRGQTNQAIYLVQDGTLELFSAFTFSQHKVAKQVQIIPDREIESYPKQGFVAPLDNTLVKSNKNNTVYLMEKTFKRPVTAEIFKNRGLSIKQVVTLSADEIGSFAIGAYATPKDKTFFAAGKALYMYKAGAKHSISTFVAKQRGITADYTFGANEAAEWLDGIAIPPRDNTLVKGDASGSVYVVLKGQLRLLTATAFKRRHYSIKNIKTLPQVEVDGYAKGEIIAK